MSSLSCLLNEPFPSTVSPSTLWLTPWLVHLPVAQRRKQREVFEADGVGRGEVELRLALKKKNPHPRICLLILEREDRGERE